MDLTRSNALARTVIAAMTDGAPSAGANNRRDFIGAPRLSPRSAIYQVNVGGRRAVLKIPFARQPSVDTGASLSASEQYQALERAWRASAEDERFAVAQPFAVFPAEGALLIEHVPGPTLHHLIEAAPVSPDRATSAVAAAGRALKALHSRSGAGSEAVDLQRLAHEVLAAEQRVLAPIGVQLDEQVRRTLKLAPPLVRSWPRVVLHGDYVPRNLIVTGAGRLTMIDMALADAGLPEDDVARFLAVLSSAPTFVPGLVVPQLAHLRRRLERAFRDGYGPPSDGGAVLELRLLHQLVLRWRRRRELSRLAHLRPLLRLRGRLIDRHLRTLVLESCGRVERILSAPRQAAS